ncbi:hypothetical protein CYMTET_32477 [Cymbomonas tetramitiformis]|uniref:Uncharacterized protein n=1 Tax=Cymbomonas tetramitiformis TaxID=36881 RepID=A0AAE0FFD0_9CHLO|nr:hypothetical protein CYMTET_32477 [Cymbomonas tetramitiformis]
MFPQHFYKGNELVNKFPKERQARKIPVSITTATSTGGGSTQSSQLEKLRYVETESTEERRAKYDKHLAARFPDRKDPSEYRGIPYTGEPRYGKTSSDRKHGLGVRKPVIAKLRKADPTVVRPAGKRADGQESQRADRAVRRSTHRGAGCWGSPTPDRQEDNQAIHQEEHDQRRRQPIRPKTASNLQRQGTEEAARPQ